jgi:hypothetical protein
MVDHTSLWYNKLIRPGYSVTVRCSLIYECPISKNYIECLSRFKKIASFNYEEALSEILSEVSGMEQREEVIFQDRIRKDDFEPLNYFCRRGEESTEKSNPEILNKLSRYNITCDILDFVATLKRISTF